MGEVKICEVRNIFDIFRFIKVEFDIKKADKSFVPPFIVERFLNLRANAFYKHGKVKLFLASKGKEVLGRISAQIDYLYIKRWNDMAGFFGFFESVDSEDVAKELFSAAEKFVKSQGVKSVMGPFSFNINGESGILVEGFDYPPYIMMPHNPPYYSQLIESLGFSKAKDLYAWRIDSELVEKKTSSFIKLIWKEASGKVKVKNISKKTLAEDIKTALDIFNDAWHDNWGFTPVTEEEGKQLANSLKFVLDEEIAFFALVDGEKPAGVCIAIPNLNEVLRNTSGGMKLSDYIKIFKGAKKVKSFRLLILGVKKDFRARYPYLPMFMVGELVKRGKAKGYKEAELSWTLEDNERINKLITISGAERYKIYRIYRKELHDS